MVYGVVNGVNYQGKRNETLDASDVGVAKQERVNVGEVVGGKVESPRKQLPGDVALTVVLDGVEVTTSTAQEAGEAPRVPELPAAAGTPPVPCCAEDGRDHARWDVVV